MKFLLLSLTTFISFISFGQVKNQLKIENVSKEVINNLQLPTSKQIGKKEALGKYTFTVELDGSLSDIKVKDSIGYDIDAQIVKTLQFVKNCSVAEVNGVPTRIAYSLPIRIRFPKK